MMKVVKCFKDIEKLLGNGCHNHNDIETILESLDKIVIDSYQKKAEFHKNYRKLYDSGPVKFNVGEQRFSTHELNITRRIKQPNGEEFYREIF